ncbi:MAG TPA: hypothetical protein VEJ67_09320 [Candidatus Cybelea sp.]|nr:hypothetical protein [Candidatus Cybelea sp.]
MFIRRNSPSPTTRLRVLEDWIRALPGEKSRVFDSVVRQWECSYAMMSVALDEALSRRARGELVCAEQQLAVVVDLLRRFSTTLVNFCEIAIARGRRLGMSPAVEPMRTEFFRGETGRSAASWNRILHHVFFARRFQQKLRIVADTIVELDEQFAAAADELSRGTSIAPMDCWRKLDCLHYDLNTCLREAEIMLKSFLRALPAEQLEVFSAELEAPLTPKRAQQLARTSPASA